MFLGKQFDCSLNCSQNGGLHCKANKTQKIYSIQQGDKDGFIGLEDLLKASLGNSNMREFHKRNLGGVDFELAQKEVHGSNC